MAYIIFVNPAQVAANQYTFVQFVDISGAISKVGTDGFTALDAWRQFAPAIVAFIGLIVISVLTKLNVKGSVLIGVLSSAFLYFLWTWELPAFFTLIMMPLTYSISNGIGIGCISYILITYLPENTQRRISWQQSSLLSSLQSLHLYLCNFIFT